MKIAGYDIETIPNQSLPPECIPVFNPDDVKLGNLKDPAKIEAKLEAEREKFEVGLDKKMSVAPRLCQVCTFVGFIFETRTGEVEDKISLQDQPDDEYDILWKGWTWLKKALNEKVPLVDYNGTAFDLRVLHTRAMKSDIRVSQKHFSDLSQQWNATRAHYDLSKCLIYFDRAQSFISLDYWLNYYDVGQKSTDFDATQVYPAWKAGEFEKIRKYCEEDVLSTCKLFARVESWITIES